MESDAEGLKTWRQTISGRSIHPSIHPTSTHLSNLLSIHSSTHPSIHPHIRPSTYPSTHWSTHLPICFCKLIFSMNLSIIFHSFFSFSLFLPLIFFLLYVQDQLSFLWTMEFASYYLTYTLTSEPLNMLFPRLLFLPLSNVCSLFFSLSSRQCLLLCLTFLGLLHLFSMPDSTWFF